MASQAPDDSKTKSEGGTTGIDKKRRQRVSYDEDSISPNPTSEDNNMESFHKKRARRVSFADNSSGTSLSPNPQRNNEPNIASANSNHEKGLLQFIQTPNWSDVNFTATQIAPRSTSRFKVGEPATKPITGINTEGTHVDGSSYPRDKRPSLSDSKASKSSDLPGLNKKHQPQQSNQSVLNDPKWCRDFSERLADFVDPADKKCHEAMTADELEDSLFIHFANSFCITQEIYRRLIVSENTIEQQEKCLKSYKDKLSSADARNRELETSVLSLKKKLASYEKEHTELNVKLGISSAELNKCTQDVTELNTKVDSLSTTLQAMNEQFSTTEAAWTSEKNMLMSTVESLTKQIQQLEGEKSAVADDRRWLIREGFKHVVNKLRASDELLKLVGEVNTRASHVGFQEGLKAGYHFSKTGVPIESTSCYDVNARNKLVRATQDFERASFPYLEKLAACADCDDPLVLLKSVEPIASQASTT